MTKQEAIFNKIVDVVTKDYFISREDFFSNSMKRALLDARNTVMWYALQKGLSIKQIANLTLSAYSYTSPRGLVILRRGGIESRNT